MQNKVKNSAAASLSMSGSSTLPAPLSRIDGALSELGSRIKRISILRSTLQTRLAPVMQPVNNTKELAEPGWLPDCRAENVANSIDHLARIVDSEILHFENLLEQLET